MVSDIHCGDFTPSDKGSDCVLYVYVPGFNMHNSIFVLIYTLGLSGKGQQGQSCCPMAMYFLAHCGKVTTRGVVWGLAKQENDSYHSIMETSGV